MSSEKPWDRPWSMDEIISNCENWSLAGDVALLNTLKSFADSLLSRTNDINVGLQNLTNNLDETSLRLNIAQNEFRSLRNTQFIESRVYEDDESLPREENKPKEEEKTDHTEEIKLAALKGLEILDRYFDKVEVSVSDSEDDDIDLPNYVLRPKDLYSHRPLPYVIGTEEWHKSLHVGLEDSSSDSETEKVSDNFSESDSESDLPIIQDRSQIKGTSDTSSEFDFSQKTDSKVKEFLHSSDSDNSVPAATNSNFAEQLAAKLGTVIQDYEPEINKRPLQPPRSNYGDIFFDEPPPLDEPKGLFSGGAGLFDDDDEKFEPKASTGVFDGGDGSDEDIFGKGAAEPKPPLFVEEPPALDEKKRPIGGVSIFGGGNVFDKKLLRRQQSSSEDEEEHKVEEKKVDLFGDDDLFKNPTRNEEIFSKINTGGEKTTKTVNLFDSEEEDETKNLFVEEKVADEKPPKENKKQEEKVQIKEEKKVSLFDDDDLFKDDLFSTNTKKSFTSGLFDDIPDDDLFEEKPKLSTSLFDDLQVPGDKNSINNEDGRRKISIGNDAKSNEPNLFDSPPEMDFLSSTPHATPAPDLRLFDPSPPPDDDWDSKSENLENLSESDDLLNDFPKVESKASLFSEEPPSLDFKPSPKKPGKLKHNLNINVGALMPGSTPPKRAEISPVVTSPDDVIKTPRDVIKTSPPAIPVTPPSNPATSLDEADRVEVLQSVTKDRARVPLRRRPSTRRGRKAALRNSMTDFKLEHEESEEDGNENSSKTEAKPEKSPKLFDESSERKNFPGLEKVARETPKESEKLPKSEKTLDVEAKLFDESSESDDLFTKFEQVTRLPKEPQNLPQSDDLFGTSPQIPESDLFESSQKVREDHDLFASLEASKDDDLFGGKADLLKTDDLFGTSAQEPEDDLFESSHKLPKTTDDLFTTINPPQTDDLFSEKVPKNIPKNTEASQRIPSDRGLFDEKPKNPPRTEERRKPEDHPKSSLFDDDDDDEGDLFTSKKPTQSARIKKALFDDDDNEDDIFKSFSSTSVKKTETKMATEKKIPKMSGVKKLENTKPDDDPLSALLK